MGWRRWWVGAVAVLASRGTVATLERCTADCARPPRRGLCPVRFAPTQVFDGDNSPFDLEYRSLTFSPCPGSNATRHLTHWHEESNQGWTVQGEVITALPDSYAATEVLTRADGSPYIAEIDREAHSFDFVAGEVEDDVFQLDLEQLNMSEPTFEYYGARYRYLRIQEIGSVSFQRPLGKHNPRAATYLEFLDLEYWPRHVVCALCAPRFQNKTGTYNYVTYAVHGNATVDERVTLTFRGSRRPAEWHETATPTVSPAPTSTPTLNPTGAPTVFMPTGEPTRAPTGVPSTFTSHGPTPDPTAFAPTPRPTPGPTVKPTAEPTATPTTAAPTSSPTPNATSSQGRRRLNDLKDAYGLYEFEVSFYTKTGAIRMAWLDLALGNLSAVVGVSHGRVPEWKALDYSSVLYTEEAVGCVANAQNCSVEEAEAGGVRPIGPTSPAHPFHRQPRGQVPPFQQDYILTRQHPWKPAPPHNARPEYCQFGCAQFYTNWTLEGCAMACDRVYRHETTAGYSDRAEVARYECRDGCAIAMYRCQPGFSCRGGAMTLCPAGKYRDLDYWHVTKCDDCPQGRYRSTVGGRTLEACDQCDVGRFNRFTGAADQAACLACPPGRFSNEKGMQQCKCQNQFDGNFEYAPNGTALYADCETFNIQSELREVIDSIDYAPRTTYP